MSGLRKRLKDGARRAGTVLLRPTYRTTLAFVMGRDELPRVLNARGLLGSGVEVGVKTGEYSEAILATWRGRRLLSVDSWAVQAGDDPADPELGVAAQERYLAEARERLARFGPRSEIRRQDSLAAARSFAPGSLDFVYIDARHDLESVRADISAWRDRVRPGGLIAGHDYFDGPRHGDLYGVASAVDEFCERTGLRAATTLREHPERSWFVALPGAAA